MGKVSWRPRHGQRLSALDKRRSKLEDVATSYLGKIPKIFLYPVWGLVVGALVTFSGRGELTLRSWGLLLIAVWLSVDLWAWLLPRTDKYHIKYAFGWTATNVMLIGMMGIMWWWMDGKLGDQREEVFQHLTADHSIPPGFEDDPVYTVFTVENGSSYPISKRHGITCLTNFAVGNGGTSARRLMSTWMDGQQMVLSGSVHTFDRDPALTLLEAGGDAQSEQCLRPLDFQSGTDCADVTVIFWYTLQTQLENQQLKQFRFVAERGKTGQFSWYKEPIEQATDYYCKSYLKPKTSVPFVQTKTKPWFEGSIAGMCYSHPDRKKARFWMRELPKSGKICYVPMSDPDSMGSIYEAEDEVEKHGGGLVEVEPHSIRPGTHNTLGRKYADVSLSVAGQK
jgi:hypothetical protein